MKSFLKLFVFIAIFSTISIATAVQNRLDDIDEVIEVLKSENEELKSVINELKKDNEDLWTRSRYHEYCFVAVGICFAVTLICLCILGCCQEGGCCYNLKNLNVNAVHTNERTGVSLWFFYLIYKPYKFTFHSRPKLTLLQALNCKR